MMLVDTHCHLYAKEFDADREKVIRTAQKADVHKFYLPGIDSQVIPAMLALEEAYKGELFAMMGLHPCSVQQNFESELKIIETWLAKRKFVAIGEIGLDFYWDKTFAQQQVEAFNRQMQWALHYNLPVVIHTRNAMEQTINAVQPFAKKGLRGIFHCFGDTEEVALQIIAMGFLLGIGGVITYKNSGVALALKNVAVEHLVLETDAPYLAPVPHRGQRNESSYLLTIAQRLAQVKNISPEEVAVVTTANAEKLFRH